MQLAGEISFGGSVHWRWTHGETHAMIDLGARGDAVD